MRIDVHHHFSRGKEAPPWVEQLADKLGLALDKLESMMATVEELSGVIAEIGEAVNKVSADTEKLLADLANIPTPGMTPEQQAAVDAAVESATAIRDRLKALDDKVPDAA
jgi:seryl-tRNA synthetase